MVKKLGDWYVPVTTAAQVVDEEAGRWERA